MSESTQDQLDALRSAITALEDEFSAVGEAGLQGTQGAEGITINVKGEVKALEQSSRNGIGLLLPLSPSHVAAGPHIIDICCSPASDNVYALREGGAIDIYERTESGALKHTGSAPVADCEECRGICISDDGFNVYVAGFNKVALVAVFQRNGETGALSELEQITTVENAHDVLVSPDGLNVYVVQEEGKVVEIEPGVFRPSCGIYAFAREPATGSITLMGEHQVLHEKARRACISQDGLNIYLACESGHESLGSLAVYTRDPSGGELALLEQIEGGIKVYAVAIDLEGKNVYALDTREGLEGGNVLQFSRDAETGALTPLTPSKALGFFGSRLADIVVSTDLHNVYASGDFDQVSQYLRESGTGPLVPAPITTMPTSGESMCLCLSPDGTSVYVGCWNTETVSQFNIE
jgi:hypothetical protein